MKKILKGFMFLGLFLSLSNCVSTQARKNFSKNRYGSGNLADAANNDSRSRLDQVKRAFNTPRY